MVEEAAYFLEKDIPVGLGARASGQGPRLYVGFWALGRIFGNYCRPELSCKLRGIDKERTREERKERERERETKKVKERSNAPSTTKASERERERDPERERETEPNKMTREGKKG